MKTITYTVYKPNYTPGNGMHSTDTKLKAFRLARKLGTGSNISMNVNIEHSDGSSRYYVKSAWEVIAGKYFSETQRNGRPFPSIKKPKQETSVRTLDVNGRYASIFRKYRND